MLLTGSVFRGRFEMGGARFDRGVSLMEARLLGAADLSGCTVAEFADLRWSDAADVDLSGSLAAPTADLRLPAGVDLPRQPAG